MNDRIWSDSDEFLNIIYVEVILFVIIITLLASFKQERKTSTAFELCYGPGFSTWTLLFYHYHYDYYYHTKHTVSIARIIIEFYVKKTEKKIS